MQSDNNLDELFSQAALKYQDNTAVTYTDGLKQQDLTYDELNKTSLQISSCLKTFYKRQNMIVGLYSRNCPALIACMIGVLRIPAAFAPIGLDWPKKMVKHFLEATDISVLLVDVELLEAFKQMLELFEDSKKTFKIFKYEILSLIGFALITASDLELSNFFVTDYNPSLAYVMQTSGTTGSPKIVKVPHMCIVPNITSLTSMFDITSDDSIAVVSPYTFDPFIVQLFLALSSGSRAVIISEDIKLQAGKLCTSLFDELKISVLQPTPFLMYFIGQERIQNKVLGQDSFLRVLAFGGEACPPISILQKWKHPDCKTRLFNLYGITEVSSWASCFEITDKELQGKCNKMVGPGKIFEVEDMVISLDDVQDNVPLGIPLDDTILEVRDENESKIDEGVGCIFIGGKNRVCYLDNETSFMPGTMRSTGDFGYIKDNMIWYCGRKNRQIKRQGKRISLDWLEQCITKVFPSYIFCAVSDTCLIGQQQKLYLFIKPETLYDDGLFLTSLKKAFEETLPLYAHPDYVRLVNTIPMTSHGKVDTRALLRSYQEEKVLSTDEPGQEILAKIWVKGITKFEDNATRTFLSKEKCLTNDKSSLSYSISSSDGYREGQGGYIDTTKELLSSVKNEDMFVDHGGTSITALRVANEIETWLLQKVAAQVDLSQLVDVILNSSFGTLCEYVEKRVSRQSKDNKITVKTVIKDDKKLETAGPSELDKSQQSCKGDASSSTFVHNVAGETSSGMHPQHFDFGKRSKSMNNHDYHKEITRSVFPKKRKIGTGQIETVTDLTNCFCSVQRGMHVTTCTSCMASRVLNKVHYQELSKPLKIHGSFKVEICFKWKTNLNKCIDASPLVVSKNNKKLATVYLGSHAHVFKAVHLSSGMELWETRVGDRIESSAALSKCGLYVIVGCYDGKIYVFNRHNGKVVWTFQTGGPVKSSPCVDPSSGLVWIGSHDHHLYALDVNQEDCISSIDCGSSCFSSPCVLDNPHLVFIGTLGGRIVCIDGSEHKVKWTNMCPKPIFSSPQATSRGVIYACVDTTVYCYDFNGYPLWEFKTSGPVFSSPSRFVSSDVESSGNILFGSHDGCVYCISYFGVLRWRFETDSQVYSTPFVTQLFRDSESRTDVHQLLKLNMPDVRGPLKLLSEEPEEIHATRSTLENDMSIAVVVVCSTNGTMYCLSLDKGLVVSSWSFPGQVFSSPVVFGNDVLVGCRDNFLYCLEIKLSKHIHQFESERQVNH